MNLRSDARTVPVPTRAGFILIGASLVALAGGLLGSNNEVLFLGCLSSGAIATSFLLCRVNLSRLEARRNVPEPLFAGAVFREEIVVANRRRLLPSYLVVVRDRIFGTGVPRLPSFFLAAVVHLPPSQEVTVRTDGMFFQRGRKRFVGIEIASTFPLGLFRARRTVAVEDEVVAYPRLSPLPASLFPESRPYLSGSTPVRAAAGDEDFAGLREFRPGDNPKWIHWKSSVRLDGRLLVREFERHVVRHAEIRLETRVASVPGRSHHPFERAIRAAASVLHDLVARGHTVRLEISGDRLTVLEIRPNDATLLDALEVLAVLEPARGGADGIRNDDRTPAWDAVPHLVIRPADFAGHRPIEEVLRWR